MEIEEEDPGIPEWVVTFGDMMSLLLTFFIMLVSMSEIKQEEKFQAMLESMRRQFGHEASIANLIPGQSAPRNSSMSSLATLARAKRKDLARGGNKIKSVTGEDNRVRTVRPGEDTTVGGVIFFDEDSTELTPYATDRLYEIAAQVAGKPQKIEIRGHASRKPIPGTDHWEVALQRGRVVMEFLVNNEKHKINPKRIRLGSAGSHEPLDDSVDPIKRKRNARVEVLMWDESVSSS